MKIIKLNYEFEKQSSPNIFEFYLNKKDDGIIFKYLDGYELVVDKNIQHKDNKDKIEAKLIDKNGEIKLFNWSNSKEDENAFELYNWKMNLKKKNNKYIIELKVSKHVGGGAL